MGSEWFLVLGGEAVEIGLLLEVLDDRDLDVGKGKEFFYTHSVSVKKGVSERDGRLTATI